MKVRQRVFDVLGWLGFLAVLPVVLHFLGIAEPLTLVQRVLGSSSAPSFLVLLFFVLIAVGMLFGGGRTIGPLLLAGVGSFLLISTAVEISFMGWFSAFARKAPFFNNTGMVFISGVGVMLLGTIASYFKRVPLLLQILLFLLLPVGFLTAADHWGWKAFGEGLPLSANAAVAELAKLVDEKHRAAPEVQDFVKKVAEDKDLTIQEKERQIQDLQKRIAALEAERAAFDKVREENDLYRRENEGFRTEIDRLKDRVKDVGWCSTARNDIPEVKAVTEAMFPAKPCVRDLAVHIAASRPGQYGETSSVDGLPGDAGVAQVCALHTFLSNSWKYVSDPTRSDYFSPPDRTVALGYAGDCDDFSILVASCVEAIGGKARIVAGSCPAGGHAWCEVLVGRRAEWTKACAVIESYYGRKLPGLTGMTDSSGRVWLPLDWKLGEFSCNDSTYQVLYPGR